MLVTIYNLHAGSDLNDEYQSQLGPFGISFRQPGHQAVLRIELMLIFQNRNEIIG
jgi:hypothetical protein